LGSFLFKGGRRDRSKKKSSEGGRGDVGKGEGTQYKSPTSVLGSTTKVYSEKERRTVNNSKGLHEGRGTLDLMNLDDSSDGKKITGISPRKDWAFPAVILGLDALRNGTFKCLQDMIKFFSGNGKGKEEIRQENEFTSGTWVDKKSIDSAHGSAAQQGRRSCGRKISFRWLESSGCGVPVDWWGWNKKKGGKGNERLPFVRGSY